MNDKYRAALTFCENQLVRDIIVSDIIPDLRTCSCFTLDDEEYINHEITSRARAGKLLDIIRDKENDECVEQFRDILKRTNGDLHAALENAMNSDGITRKRQLSSEVFKQILKRGDVPVRTDDYIERPELEEKVFEFLQSNSRKPISIHGIVGSGKSEIVSKVLENRSLFTEKFLNCCWMTIGDVNEAGVVIKLQALLRKLQFHKRPPELPMSNVPEILVQDIKQQLSGGTTLLIIDDVRRSELMKYFTFPGQYIVISTVGNLFSPGYAKEVHIPDGFNDEQCKQLINLKYNIQDDAIIEKIIQKSGKHPMYLHWICSLLETDKCAQRFIGQLEFSGTVISEQCINVLNENIRDYFIMLIILPFGGTIGSELLAIYWNVEIHEAFQIIRKLCDNNLMKKRCNSKYNGNLYEVYYFYLNCLKNSNHKDKLEIYEKLLVKRFFNKYKTWIAFDISDPFFFMFYENRLYKSKKFEKLTKLYCDYSFIASKIAVCGIDEVVYGYVKYRSDAPIDNWNEFESFLKKNRHIFHNLSANKCMKISKIFTTLIQCGLYELKDRVTYKSAYKSIKVSQKADLWDWINPRSSLKIWENNYGDHIEHHDINENFLFISTIKGRVILIEINDGICLFNYQISENPIILVKFFNNMEILIIDSKAQVWVFKPNDSVSGKNNSTPNYDEEYDEDFDPSFSIGTCSNNVLLFKQYFENLILNDLIEKCKFECDNKEDLEDHSFKAQFFDKRIYFFTQSKVFIYDLGFQQEDSIDLDISVEKCVLKSNRLYYYLLTDGTIELFNDSRKVQKIEVEEAILDFIVINEDVFYVTKTKVYKNSEEILCDKEHFNISKISSSNNIDLLILHLSSGLVQIWCYPTKELIHSLSDWQLKHVFILNDSNDLITISETHVAKWTLNDLQGTINYRPNPFIMQQSNSTLNFVLQTTKNEIEIRKYQNGNTTMRTVGTECEDSIANCFTCLRDFVFIGYKSGIFEVYNLMTSTEVCHSETGILNFEIISLATYKIDENNIGVLVHQSDNQMTAYCFNQNNLNIRKFNLDLPKNVYKCKFFKVKEDLLICGVYNDQTCTLYKIYDSAVCNIGRYDFGENIIDFDISGDVKYLCMISTGGLFEIREINDSNFLIKENYGNLRKCKFRPRHDFNNWRLVAIINEKVQIYLYYFCGKERKSNLLIEESSTANQIPKTLEWSSDSLYLLVGDNAIRKWKIREEPYQKKDVKLPCTILQTYFGGIQCLQVQGDFMATIDQQGFLYVLKRLE